MNKQKITHNNENHHNKKRTASLDSTLNLIEIGRAIGIFLLSFTLCFIFAKYLFSWLNSQPRKKNETAKVQINLVQQSSSSLLTVFSEKLQSLKSLLPEKKYDYYQTKRQFIDPVLIKEAIDKKDSQTLIVDIRSTQEYKSAHIKSAINVPAYTNSQDVYGTLTQKNLLRMEIGKKIAGKKLVVIYGYKSDADITQDVYEDLKQVFAVKVFGISWNDWKNNFYSWLPNAEKQSFKVEDYMEGIDVIKSTGLPQI